MSKSKLESQLFEAEQELEKIIQDTPETQARQKVQKLQDKIHKQARKDLVSKIKGKKSAIARALKAGEALKERRQALVDDLGELEEQIKVNVIKQRDLGAESGLLTIKLDRFDNPVKIRSRDTSGIYEEEDY